MSTRLRLKFSKEGALRYIGHLDMARVWERILRRARLPVAFSQGFHPQPKLQFAAALPVGCASTAELMDVVLAQDLTPEQARQAIEPQLPAGLGVLAIEAVPLNAPALQATLQSADYVLTIETSESLDEISRRAQALLAAPTLPRERRGKAYDLRPLILDLRVEAVDRIVTLWARLRASQTAGTGRPDELLDALSLGDTPAQICRTGLEFGDQRLQTTALASAH